MTIKLSVTAHPNSKKPRIDKDLFGQLHVYVNAPPLLGLANKAVIEVLAEYFGSGDYFKCGISKKEQVANLFQVKGDKNRNLYLYRKGLR